MRLEPGLKVTDNVVLLRPVGEGAMGCVWVAEHQALDTEIAVKFMMPELATHPDAIARFKREARAAAQLRSPHVVKMLDFGLTREAHVPFMTMELLEGEDLEEHVARAGPLSIDETALVIAQVAKALSEAHELGIVHRDIKPENVFLTRSGGDLFVKVLDFGVAKQAGRTPCRVTCSGTTIGTPVYMSPEQIVSARDVDYRCDLWSLAVTAYFCLTGRVPFEGETFGAVCISIDRGRLRMPSSLRDDASPALDAWFIKALRRQIDARFTSAKEMSDAFTTAIDASAPGSISISISLPRVGRFPRFGWRTALGETVTSRRQSVVRTRVVAAAGLVTMLLLVAGASDIGRTWRGATADARSVRFVSPALAFAGPLVPLAPPPASAPTMPLEEARSNFDDHPLEALAVTHADATPARCETAAASRVSTGTASAHLSPTARVGGGSSLGL